jgi:hypothetical protein
MQNYDTAKTIQILIGNSFFEFRKQLKTNDWINKNAAWQTKRYKQKENIFLMLPAC